MLKRIKALFFPQAYIIDNLLDRVEELEMLVDELEQRIDRAENQDYNLRNYTLGK